MVGATNAREIVVKFVEECIRKGIPVKEAWLFGSYAKGKEVTNSDVDLALIANSFGNNIIINSKQTALIKWNYPVVEIHHFNPSEFSQDSPFINEIKRTGIKIY